MSDIKEIDQSSTVSTFNILWALAIIFHQVSYAGFSIALKAGFWPSILIDAMVNIACCLVIYAPKSPKWFTLMLTSISVKFVYELPHVSNHLQLLALISSALLISQIRRDQFPIEGLKLTTVAIYFLVTLHKLNAGFFSHPGSCADYYGKQVLENFLPPLLLEPMINLMPGLVTLVEALIAASLFSNKWNHIGVILGFLLHFALGLDLERRFYNFSALMFALLFLFISPASIESLVRRLKADALYRQILALLFEPAARLMFVFVLLSLQFGLAPTQETTSRIFSFRGIITLWFLLSLLLTGLVATFVRHPSYPTTRRKFSTLVLPFFILVLGLGPYIGFRTRLSLDMYSNLEVENGRSNHFLLPSLDLWGLLSDTVTIEKSTDRSLMESYSEKNLKLIGIEFERYLDTHPDEEIVYSRDGKRFIALPGRDKSHHSMLTYKLVTFRPANESQISICQW